MCWEQQRFGFPNDVLKTLECVQYLSVDFYTSVNLRFSMFHYVQVSFGLRGWPHITFLFVFPCVYFSPVCSPSFKVIPWGNNLNPSFFSSTLCYGSNKVIAHGYNLFHLFLSIPFFSSLVPKDVFALWRFHC
jgi:hypothetical protein